MIDSNKTFGVVGICGANANLIARVLSDRGFKVIGTDMSSKEECRFASSLEGYDIKVYHGGNPDEFFDEIDYLVPPPSLSKKSKIFTIAQEKNIKIFELEDVLETFRPDKPVFGITGTNGKTTSINLLKKIAYDNGIIPTEHNLANMQGNAEYLPILQSRLNGEVAILEVGTFGVKGTVERTCVNSDMSMALMTNITPDHLTTSFLDYAHVKGELISSLNGKKIIVNAQDPTILGLLKELDFQGEVITFGLDWVADDSNSKQCVCGEELTVKEIISGSGYYFCRNCGLTTPESDFIATNIDLENRTFDLFDPLGEKIEVKMLLDGLHNVYNVSGVIVAAHEFLDLPYDKIVKSVSTFTGVSGRMEKICQKNGKDIISDYAHNPGGVDTVLRSFNQLYDTFAVVITISSESGEVGDNEIFDKVLQYSNYIVACSKASQKVAKERITKNPELKERILLSQADESFIVDGTTGASLKEVENGIKTALTIDCEAIITIGQAGTEYFSSLKNNS
ncbi:MAG: UDP-N-acetylmuramate--alanine ligase [archaeon]|nr:UDP-N-acetylmuramate--alanine ligase [archaeon]